MPISSWIERLCQPVAKLRFRASVRIAVDHIMLAIPFSIISPIPKADQMSSHRCENSSRTETVGEGGRPSARRCVSEMRNHIAGLSIPCLRLFMNPLATWPLTSIRCSRFANGPPKPPRSLSVQRVVRCARTRKSSGPNASPVALLYPAIVD